MALVIWAEKYSVGVDRLDKDHIVLASLLNHVDEAKRFLTDERIVGQVISAFVDHAFTHFRREERLLEKYRYPDLANHQKLHQSLGQELGHLVAAHERSLDPAISDEIVNFLCVWLDDHLLKADMRYKPFLKNAMAGPADDGAAYHPSKSFPTSRPR